MFKYEHESGRAFCRASFGSTRAFCKTELKKNAYERDRKNEA